MIIDAFALEEVVGESAQQRVASNEGRVHRTEGPPALIINSSTLYHAVYTYPCQLLLYFFPFPISTKNGPIAFILRGCLRVVASRRRS